VDLENNKYDVPKLQGGHSFSKKRHPNNRNHGVRHEGHRTPLITNEIIETPQPEVVEQEEFAADFEAKRIIRIAQIKENILRQLNLGTPPNVSGIVETSNPSVKEMIDEVSEANKRPPQNPDYIQDAPSTLKKTFIPVEERKFWSAHYLVWIKTALPFCRQKQ